MYYKEHLITMMFELAKLAANNICNTGHEHAIFTFTCKAMLMCYI